MVECPCRACQNVARGPLEQYAVVSRNHMRAEARLRPATPAIRRRPRSLHSNHNNANLPDPNGIQHGSDDYDAAENNLHIEGGSNPASPIQAPSPLIYNNPESDSDDELLPRLPLRGSLNGLDDEHFSDDASTDDSADEDDAIELSDHPWFKTGLDLVQQSKESDIDDYLATATTSPPAFDEDPTLRNVYIRAFIQHAYHGATHAAVNEYLDSQHKMFVHLVKTSGLRISESSLNHMARTLPTVERRLGLSTAPYLTYWIVCPLCWTIHHPKKLNSLRSPICASEDCNGLLYSIKGNVRVPSKIVSVANLRVVLQRIMLRPGKYEQMQHWRGLGDEPGPAEPISEASHRELHSDTEVMEDIADGWGWRAIQAGLARHTTQSGRVFDKNMLDTNQRFVSLPCGLVLILNLDW